MKEPINTSSQVILFHNPDCSKSSCALELLQEHKVKAQVINYLKTPPDEATLRQLVRLLDVPFSQLIRRNEPEYAALFGENEPSEEACLDAMLRFPKLIQRPIVLAGNKAVIGRPPERILELFPMI